MKVGKWVKNGTGHIYAPGLNLSSLVVKVYYKIYFRVTPVLCNNYLFIMSVFYRTYSLKSDRLGGMEYAHAHVSCKFHF